MGNCQAIDAATLVIQHPGGKVDKLYWPVTAREIMKMNPGHYVALLISTAMFTPNESNNNSETSSNSVRLTRIKLLRPADMLVLGQVYRLITSQEVMRGLSAKKQAKVKQNQLEAAEKPERRKEQPPRRSDAAAAGRRRNTRRTTDQGQVHRRQPRPRPDQEHGNLHYIASQKVEANHICSLFPHAIERQGGTDCGISW